MNYRNSIVLRVWLCAFISSVTLVSLAEYRFVKVVDTESVAPEGTFSSFMGASISRDTVAFQGFYGSVAAIFKGNAGSLLAITTSDDSGPNGKFTFLGTAANTAIDDGAVVFFAFTSTGSGILRGDGSSLTSAVKTGDVAPSGSFLGVNSPSISGDNLSFLGEDDGGFGVFKISDGVVTAIARSGDGSPFGNTFHSFGATAISDNAVAFTAAAGGQGAIYVRDGGPLIAIAGPGSLSPVGPLSFLNTFGLAIDDGVVAFNSGYSAGNGVFMGDGTSITPIATTGTPAPNGKFNSFGVPSIGDGRVAFSGTYSGGGQGVFVGNGGLLETVIKNGDMLFGETLTSVFGQVGIDPHGTGNIAFSYTLANGVRGIAIALPVPEPDSITFVLSWLTGLAFFRRRRPLTS